MARKTQIAIDPATAPISGRTSRRRSGPARNSRSSWPVSRPPTALEVLLIVYAPLLRWRTTRRPRRGGPPRPGRAGLTGALLRQLDHARRRIFGHEAGAS